MKNIFSLISIICMILLHTELAFGSTLPKMESQQAEKSNIPEIIQFNVGGKTHMTTFSTISSQGENLLTQLVRNHYDGTPGTVDGNGAIFIDRNGKLFRDVLDYLRTGEYPSFSDALRREFEYYQIESPAKQPTRVFHLMNFGSYLTIYDLNSTDADLIYFMSECSQTVAVKAKVTCTSQSDRYITDCNSQGYMATGRIAGAF
eukprot:TRINITY_DN2672_c0_g1::TRINITY_DN2672_c0_g1_i1::g.26036::m.26036 TRINITY_DN2672_c0_g1::TRINITY_DN2672_c0_g1_i1::g.26036  ORF type:complete len:203 (+),score=34.73,sp/Q6DG99/KCTD6_DANRE/39.33/3e-10,BTB_2/PF02214.17/2.5e-13,Mesd/PF10185.4/0.53,Mesd/PF10185.4/1.3e+03 TRINITY_DN2672_c0_g1_i1:45-653(+)